MKVKNNKIKFLLAAAVLVAVAFISLMGCSKANEEIDNSSVGKDSSSYTIELEKNEIDVLSREIGIAHNCVLFSLYRNPGIDGLSATELCHYIHDFLVANGDAMGLVMLPNYMRTADSIGEAMAEIYSSIGRLIENEGTDWYLPDNVDQELIIRTMEEYYAFVNEAFLESDTYDEFENACLDHLQALCDETKTINDYFYLNACGNITFASYCAWVSIFSGYNTNAKGLLGDSREWLREKYQIVKGYVVEKIIKPIENIVSADLMGGAIGGTAGLLGGAGVAFATGQAYAPLVGLVGGFVVGAAAGSLFF